MTHLYAALGTLVHNVQVRVPHELFQGEIIQHPSFRTTKAS